MDLRRFFPLLLNNGAKVYNMVEDIDVKIYDSIERAWARQKEEIETTIRNNKQVLEELPHMIEVQEEILKLCEDKLN